MRTVRRLAGVLALVLFSTALVLGVSGPASASGGGFHNAPGTIHIQNRRSGLCIDPLTESVFPDVVLIQYTCRNAKSQEWEESAIIGFAPDGGELHVWINNNSRMCMAPVDPEGANGSKVQQVPCAFDPLQYWELYSGPRNSVFFFNFANHKCLDLENGDPTVGVEMQVWDCNFGTQNQEWDLL